MNHASGLGTGLQIWEGQAVIFPMFLRCGDAGSFLQRPLTPGCPRAHALRNTDLGIKWKAQGSAIYCIL